MHRILIVEDSSTMRSLIASALESLAEPCRITEAASGFEALAARPRATFDSIVADINGLEWVSLAKSDARHRDVPLPIVSTEGSERDRAKGMSFGADAYVVNPFQPEELRRMAEGFERFQI
ncbi:MAG: response regulator [Deltaproteobacteria bacterium]|nr:response regulator [Deltaproteobacteria bacterium]MBW2360384.1 response regulator [Deltaproteobacteria bacterium]